jgi:acyl carrier protein
MAEGRTIADQIIAALADYLKRDKKSIALDHNLRDDLGLDSMATIELVYQIEDVFDLQIPDQDLVGLTTVGNVVRYVEERLSSSEANRAAGTTGKAKRGKS